MQTKLIPAILNHKHDYFIEKETGAGKTISIALSLLNLAHADYLRNSFIDERLRHNQANVQDSGSVSKTNHAFYSPLAVLVVPNRELGLQIQSWMQNLASEAFPNIPSSYLAQTFIKSELLEKRQESLLEEFGVPSIVIGTPTRLLDLVIKKNRIPIDFRLRRIVVDEIDMVIQLLGKNASLKKRMIRLKNPKDGQILVESLIRKFWDSDTKSRPISKLVEGGDKVGVVPGIFHLQGAIDNIKEGKKRLWLEKEMKKVNENLSESLKPLNWENKKKAFSLICMSATINSDLRKFLKSRGWFPNAVKIIQSKTENMTVPSVIQHSCIVVDELESIRNIRDKIKSNLDTNESNTFGNGTSNNGNFNKFQNDEFMIKNTENGLEIHGLSLDNGRYNNVEEANIKDNEVRSYRGSDVKPKPNEINEDQYNEIMTECVANILAAESEFVKTVVIFYGFGGNYKGFIENLNKSGVKAESLMNSVSGSDIDNSIDGNGERENRVYVSAEASGRGMDLKNVSHVLVLGAPKTAASYLHMAGRTGRFGKPGKAITVVVNKNDSRDEGKVRGIYSQLGIQSVPLNYVPE
ncbi:hypothetical protein BB558_000337 [Smittium angustum]|uniref:RNA helicase n=1 Tax=Smittium angustum TaxID=133377 RepID=A0A2U1JEG9_SMIAN|nr:hypothetical protein BB558_000337 [Smittium angustum]